MKFRASALVSAVAAMAFAGSAFAADLVINANTSDPAPRAAFTEVVEKFKAANPGMDVEFNVSDHEAYKTEIRNFLAANEGPDVGFWFSGERMAGFQKAGLLEDISSVWDENNLHEAMASTRSGITFDGKQYGMPYSYYQWGVYYREDIFADAGLSVPETFDDFLVACTTLKAKGIAPVTIGTKYLWTAAGWFDYINLRTNGLDFHIDLMLGKIPYTDERVIATMTNWKKAIYAGCFIDNHVSYSWQEAQPFFYQKDSSKDQAAMYLIGNFITPGFPEDVAGDMGFFQFPSIDPEVGMYEDAPTDIVFVPANAQNKDNAKKFLAFLSQAENIEAINKALKQLPPHKDAAPLDDKFLNAGAAMLAAADGTAQFFDRDTKPEMAKIGMEGFQEFMVKPERMMRILKKIEAGRKRIFK